MLIDKNSLFSKAKGIRNPNRGDSGTWQGHIKRYNDERRNLGGRITDAHVNKCTKYIPEDAETWLYRQPPENPSETLAKSFNCTQPKR